MNNPQSDDLALFDAPNYLAVNKARWRIAEVVLEALRSSGETISSAYDLGSGPGWFASRLASCGLDVVGLEARASVVEEACRRTPEARFDVFDIDAVSLNDLPAPRDFVLCFGILYHLENPLRALRIARALGTKALLIETMTFPSPEPVCRIAYENDNATQGVRELAILMSPSALEQGLWAAGFSNVMRYEADIEHADFIDTPERWRRRHIYFASVAPIPIPGFVDATISDLNRSDYWKR